MLFAWAISGQIGVENLLRNDTESYLGNMYFRSEQCESSGLKRKWELTELGEGEGDNSNLKLNYAAHLSQITNNINNINMRFDNTVVFIRWAYCN